MIVRFLKHFSSKNLRNAIGRNSLSEVEKFIQDGYSDLLFRDLNLTSSDSILILGGYLGDSVERWLDVSNGKVLVVEPVTEYFQILFSRFSSNPRVELFQMAVGDRNGMIDIHINGMESGSSATSNLVQSTQLKATHEFLEELPIMPALIEINIEGGEYSVMQNLIESNLVDQVKTFLIQFHRYSYSDESRRGLIRKKLSDSHNEIYSYEWVWERWDRKAMAL
jgi:FkbM family methyltransferase